jgi:hypothetical protein
VNALGIRTVALDTLVEDRFDALIRQHYPRVARVIGRIVHDRSRAEELAVDVFLAWRRHPRHMATALTLTGGSIAPRSVRRSTPQARAALDEGAAAALSAHGNPVAPDVQHEAEVTRCNVRQPSHDCAAFVSVARLMRPTTYGRTRTDDSRRHPGHD